MNKKICVYAICKNEEKYIEQWLSSMSEADYIVVLDTGSTDNTFKILSDDSRVTKVEQKIIDPWRFDVARNESMKLIPEDTDICVCTDFDEVFEAGWANILRENWQDDDTRCYYTYAWSHNELGEPQDVFKYDKIHKKDGYYWKFPVHEVIVYKDGVHNEMVLDAGESIYLHHLQDTTKSRSSYLPLLIIGVEENPNDSHCRMMLAREYLIYNDSEKALQEYLKCLEYDDIYLPEHKTILIETYGRIGDIYYCTEKYDDAIAWYNKFIQIDSEHREPYFCLAETYICMGLYQLAEAAIIAGLKYSVRKFDWVERKDNWITKHNDLLSIIYYYLGDFDSAYENIKITIEHNPNNIRILRNMNAILEAKINGAIVQGSVKLD